MRSTIGYILTLAWFCGCSTAAEDASTPFRPYPLGQALVIGETGDGELTNVDESCDSEVCRAVRERCGGSAYADVVVGEDGSVLDVLCFRESAEVRELGTAPVASASAGNGTVLVLDDVADGADVTGDVALTGNGAVIYGHGADVSEIEGSVTIDKNNAIVRGVSIGGSVRIEKNNAQLSFTEIHGDLTIAGNNVTLAECVVHGQVIIEGVNTVLVNNRFSSVTALSGKNLACNGNVIATAQTPGGDAGAAALDAGAAGQEAPLACTGENGPPRDRGRP